MSPTSSTPAFKEWAVVVRALLAGEQILDVRKGGLREDGRHFSVKSPRLWLYPTYEHQRTELVKPAYQRWITTTLDSHSSKSVRGDVVVIPGWAEIVGTATITEPEVLDRLDSKLVWTREYVASRLHWKRRDPLFILAVRAYRLEEPLRVPYRAEYGGCSSWVGIDDLPADPSVLPAVPALTDESFAARLALVANELPARLRSDLTARSDRPT